MLYSELTGQTCDWRGGARHFVNGIAPDGAGGLLPCEHGTRALARPTAQGQREVPAARLAGGRLNSPDGVIRHPDGSIWFTDPTYGVEFPDQGSPGTGEQAGSFVFRLAPGTGALGPVIRDCAYPDGLALPPDGRRLQVAESGGSRSPGNERHIRVFDLQPGGRRGAGRVPGRGLRRDPGRCRRAEPGQCGRRRPCLRRRGAQARADRDAPDGLQPLLRRAGARPALHHRQQQPADDPARRPGARGPSRRR